VPAAVRRHRRQRQQRPQTARGRRSCLLAQLSWCPGINQHWQRECSSPGGGGHLQGHQPRPQVLVRPLYAPRQNSPGVQTALAPARLAAIATQSRSAAERVAAILEAIGCAQLCPYLRRCGESSRSCEWNAQTAAGSAENRQLGCDGPATSVRSGPCSSPLTWAATCLEDGKEWRGGGWPRFEREGQGGGCPWWAGSVWSESDLWSVRSCTGLIMQVLERIALVGEPSLAGSMVCQATQACNR
jgi:hypothetical protein